MQTLAAENRPVAAQQEPSVGAYLTDGDRLLYVTHRFMDGSDELVALEDCRSYDVTLWRADEVLALCEPVPVGPAG